VCDEHHSHLKNNGEQTQNMMKMTINWLRQLDSKKIYILSLVVGLFSGLGAALFYLLLSQSTHFVYDMVLRIPLPEEGSHLPALLPIGEERKWLFFFIPALGGLLVGLLAYYVAPEASGTGTESFLDAFHNKGGLIRKRVSIIKAFATLITLSSGGSAGKEGPTAQIGAGIGSLVSQAIGAGARARRTLLLAGTAGGLGAIFRAPLGGALTAVEVLYKEDFESDALIPCILSSVVAYTIFGALIGFEHIFQVHVSPLHSPTQWFFFIVLGLICFGVGAVFVTFFHGCHDKFFSKLKIKPYLVPALGGLLVGIIGFFKPEVTGASLGAIQQALNGNISDGWNVISVFAILAILKIIATSFTISSGGSGGVFGPSLFIGGMLGGMVGAFGHHYYPVLIPNIAPFVIVGMGAFFAGVANAPIASVIMVSELTGGYELLPPLLIVSAISIIFSHKFSIYKNQVKNKFHSRAHLWEVNPNLLSRFTVAQLCKGKFSRHGVIPPDISYSEIVKLQARQHSSDFIVEGKSGELAGIVSFKNHDLWEEEIPSKTHLIAHDLLVKNINTVKLSDDLYSALEKLSQTEYDKIPIVEKVNAQIRILGVLRERDIMKFYHQAFQEVAKTH